ncbi:MAG TPA: hypothetical protein VEF06_13440, partial [Bryobacteraceae bacterium]|nr:hypothetical protein [Bryobacteraceae bacterium]
MAGITGAVTNALVAMLQSPEQGVNIRLTAMDQGDPALTTIGIREVIGSNTPVEISEMAGQGQYPALAVYCDRMANTLKEKFREFSGTAHFVIEVRHSQAVLAGIESNLQTYVDAVCALLDDSRGDWGGGAFYSGGYNITYEAVARGGKNYLQRAKVG